MKKLFNDKWFFSKLLENNYELISLPHDAMFDEGRNIESKGGTNIAYFQGGEYCYKKEFNIENLEKEYFIEFDGIYQNSEIYLNGTLIEKNEYGYNSFIVNLKNIKLGINEIKVIVKNNNQPNSRWYTGSGIYRDVFFYELEKEHILINGVKIKTIDYINKIININILTNAKGELDITCKQNNYSYSKKIYTSGEVNVEFNLSDFTLWDQNNPILCHCIIIFGNDKQIIKFGIRQIELSLENGLLINGKKTLLNGACVHHDNGLLGAKTYKVSEYRKVKLLLNAGYNAIRSAHNPCSKHLLEACDELGMLVLDEYVDMWYIHKSQFDYANKVEINYQKDILSMIEKDYNHPSVIMYSIGNEVSETSENRGIELTKRMTNYVKQLDDSRLVTCGINIFFNFLYSIGLGQYSDNKAEKNAKLDFKKKKKFGSEFFNSLAGIMGADFMKVGATLPWCDIKTRDAFSYLDVAGYNYGIKRYIRDLKKYPNRFILGTETFCHDAYEFVKIAKNNPRVIGDFVWSGIDYLGEVGVGSWVVGEYCDNDYSYSLGWITAGSGRIDITGKMNSEVDYTQVCFDLKKIGMGVIPVFHYKKKKSPSAWKFSMCEKSWTYYGYEGMPTIVEVYSKDKYVELYLNDTLIGKQKFKNIPLFQFKVKYYPGTLKAISYDGNHNKVDECILKTGKQTTYLKMIPEDIYTDNDELRYIRLKFCDENGVIHSYVKDTIEITNIENAQIMGFGNGCPYSKLDYQTNKAETHYGEALLIIKPLNNGDIIIEAKSNICNSSCIISNKK